MSSEDTFLTAAESIGRRIVTEAVWHEGRCSWLGAVRDTVPAWPAVYRALEPNLYDGTAGVGLSLAHQASVTGDAAIRRTAIGAMRHAVARARALLPGRRDGFHAGSLGIAWAAARVGALLDEEELHTSARTVALVARPPQAPDRRPDVVPGSAGAILGLLALADTFDDPVLVRDAVVIGDDLIRRATVSRHGWSWAMPGRGHRHQLCGLSHGAAGIGWALLELFAAAGDERFRAGALGAFDYEGSWFDARSGTWPDLRMGGQRHGARQRIPSAAVGTWCHGEGGIALTRLRAMQLLEPNACVRDAEAALETTRADLAAALLDEIEDLSLCHGAAGAADVLLCGAAALGDQWQHGAALARELGFVALERHRATGAQWPCGAAGGTTPGLFRGLSGIAWWFLRLHDRAIPSPLTMPIRFDVTNAAA
jgi:lantibiotic modifying enzyme